MKKLFFISLTLLLLTIAFLLIYNFVFRQDAQSDSVQVPDVVAETFVAQEPSASVSKITRISREPVLSAALANQDTIYYVSKQSGTVMEMSTHGSTPREIFNPGIGNVARVNWSPDPSSVLYTTKKNTHYHLDITNQRSFLLDFSPDFIQWSGKDNRVLYKQYSEETKERALVLDTISRAQTKKLADLPFRRVEFVEIPHSLLAAYWSEPDANTASELYTVSTVSPGDPKMIHSGSYGADYLFSPDGKKVLISAISDVDGSKIALSIMNRDGAALQNLNIPTFVSKTLWSQDSKTIYYAQPTNIPAGSVLPNEYHDGTFVTRDTFWKVDVTSGKKSRIINLDELPTQLDATNLFLSPEEDILYFINRGDGSLYRLNIL